MSERALVGVLVTEVVNCNVFVLDKCVIQLRVVILISFCWKHHLPNVSPCFLHDDVDLFQVQNEHID